MPGERIDPPRPTPIYLQIVQTLIHEIERGRLASRAFLQDRRARVRGASRTRSANWRLLCPASIIAVPSTVSRPFWVAAPWRGAEPITTSAGPAGSCRAG